MKRDVVLKDLLPVHEVLLELRELGAILDLVDKVALHLNRALRRSGGVCLFGMQGSPLQSSLIYCFDVGIGGGSDGCEEILAMGVFWCWCW